MGVISATYLVISLRSGTFTFTMPCGSNTHGKVKVTKHFGSFLNPVEHNVNVLIPIDVMNILSVMELDH